MKTQILFVFFYYASVELLTSKGTSDALKLWWIVFVAVNDLVFPIFQNHRRTVTQGGNLVRENVTLIDFSVGLFSLQ